MLLKPSIQIDPTEASLQAGQTNSGAATSNAAMTRSARLETVACGAIGAMALILIGLPYAIAALRTPHGAAFLGQMYAIPDTCVYYSWTRQAADGRFAALNLFTNEPQHGLQFNLFFLLLGGIVRVTGVGIPFLYNMARLATAAATLVVVLRLIRSATPVRSIRVAAFAFAAVGGGLAWMQALQLHDATLNLPSADSDQPEALVFTSLYAFPLMGVGTLLIASAIGLLMAAHIRGDMRCAVGAGVCLLLLGNIHSYDVIQVAAAWLCYLVVDGVVNRGLDKDTVVQGLVAGLIGLPSVVYQFWALQHEAVFRARANVPTLPGQPSEYLIGYGLIGLLAVIGVVRGLKGSPVADRRWVRLAACWAVTSLILIYAAHVPFARKLIMGEGIALASLAGIGAFAAAEGLERYWPRRVTIAALCLLAIPSSALFVVRDLCRADWATHGYIDSVQSPYISQNELDAFAWMRAHTPVEQSAVMPEGYGLVYPGFTGRAVWAAHFGETPGFQQKRSEFGVAIDAQTPAEARLSFLRATGAQWLVYPVDPNDWCLREFKGHPEHAVRLGPNTPGLTRTYANSEVAIYRIDAAR